jgi:hypothetical protein
MDEKMSRSQFVSFMKGLNSGSVEISEADNTVEKTFLYTHCAIRRKMERVRAEGGCEHAVACLSQYIWLFAPCAGPTVCLVGDDCLLCLSYVGV